MTHQYIRLLCRSCGGFHYVKKRCSIKGGLCEDCQAFRGKVFIAKCMTRAEFYGTFRNIQLWTLGTSLIDSSENREKIYSWWRKYSMKINVYSRRTNQRYRPLVYIVEAGSEGTRLHIHFLHKGFLSHGFVKDIWRATTKENSNVNFSAEKSKAIKAIAYLSKYIGKSLSRYYWLGEWRKNPPNEFISICKHCSAERSLKYYDTVDKSILGIDKYTLDDF